MKITYIETRIATPGITFAIQVSNDPATSFEVGTLSGVAEVFKRDGAPFASRSDAIAACAALALRSLEECPF